MKNLGYLIYVSGLVQGVGFRYFTQHKALSLNLSGSVKNLDDGRVEINVYGSASTINQFINWLKTGGPQTAKIQTLEFTEIPHKTVNKFSIRY